LLSNFRVASLRGNYEGHLRNDNGQTDPGISSLFDFTAGEFNLLGDQFQVGPLNTIDVSFQTSMATIRSAKIVLYSAAHII
jgi:hypothetical protein